MRRCSVQGKPRDSMEKLYLDRIASQLRSLGMPAAQVVETMSEIHRRLGLHYKAPHVHIPEVAS